MPKDAVYVRAADVLRPDSVLVVIPTLNEAVHIEDCLNSLIGDDPFMRDVRIVVADGGSTDGTCEKVQRFAVTHAQVSLVDNPARLQSAGIGIAVAQCANPGHELMIRCDAHSVYPPGYVRRVAEELATRKEAASVASVMDAAGRGGFARASAWIVDTPLGSGGSAHRGGARSGWVDHAHHAGFRLDWFRRVGGYDPTFSHNEDAEYDVRLRAAGGRIWLASDIRIGYWMRETPGGLMRQYWKYGRGRARTVATHAIRPRLRQMIPAINVVILALTVALAPMLPVLLLYPALYLGMVVVVSVVGAMALRGASGLWAGPALAIMHGAWGAGFLFQMMREISARFGKRRLYSGAS